MKVYFCEQGTPEWFNLRMGVPTASECDKIITPTGKLSAQAEGLINQKLAESKGVDEETFFGSKWTDRGKEVEPEARDYFELLNACTVHQVGFITNDQGTAGCSPDALLEFPGKVDAEGLELKCPMLKTHLGWWRMWQSKGVMPSDHLIQIHASLAITGLKVWHFFSYHPAAAPLHIPVQADAFTDTVGQAVADFIIKFKAAAIRLQEVL